MEKVDLDVECENIPPVFRKTPERSKSSVQTVFNFELEYPKIDKFA